MDITRVLNRVRPKVYALFIGGVAGYVFSVLNFPLPWMLGPLFSVGLCGVMGLPVGSIQGSRQLGQFIVGCSLGLYFTPEIMRHILSAWPYILSAAFLSIFMGAIGGWALRKIGGLSADTAFFASVPGGAAEMSVMAERAGARFDQVALCHSIRILLVVSVVPIIVTFWGEAGHEPYLPVVNHFSLRGLSFLVGVAFITSFIFMKIKLPNAWLLGALFSTMTVTIMGLPVSSIPQPLPIIAQLLIGCSLGARFKPSLRQESRRLIIGILVSALVTVLLSLMLATFLAWMMGTSWSAMTLATGPGGFSEMCITAKVLQLGVPLVISFQVARLAVVVTCAPPIWRVLSRFHAKDA